MPQEPALNLDKDVRGNVEEGIGEIVALVDKFNAISDRFAEPMSDDEMNDLLEQQGDLQNAIDAVEAGTLSESWILPRTPAPTALGCRCKQTLRRREAPRSSVPTASF